MATVLSGAPNVSYQSYAKHFPPQWGKPHSLTLESFSWIDQADLTAQSHGADKTTISGTQCN